MAYIFPREQTRIWPLSGAFHHVPRPSIMSPALHMLSASGERPYFGSDLKHREGMLGQPDGWAPVTASPLLISGAVISAYPRFVVGTCPVFLFHAPAWVSAPCLSLRQDRSLVGSTYAGSHP